MSGIITKPNNTALVQPTKYLLSFPEVSDTIYFCQKANLPGVQLGTAEQATPNLDLYHSGTKISYNTFDVSFLVNEDLTAWTQIYKWMIDLSSVENTYTKRKANKKQAVLTILSNLNNPKMRIKFTNPFPISLTDLEFDTTLSAEEHIVASASFRYDWFDIEML
jgi:hypothetical protein